MFMFKMFLNMHLLILFAWLVLRLNKVCMSVAVFHSFAVFVTVVDFVVAGSGHCSRQSRMQCTCYYSVGQCICRTGEFCGGPCSL